MFVKNKSDIRKEMSLLLNRFKNGEQDADGLSCVFLKGQSIGLKMFRCEDTRDYAVRSQNLAYGHNLGPKVYPKKIDINDSYGYFTDLVDVLGYGVSNLVGQERHDEEAMLRHELSNKLKDIGISYYIYEDLHDLNVGILNGVLMCIDFVNDNEMSMNGCY